MHFVKIWILMSELFLYSFIVNWVNVGKLRSIFFFFIVNCIIVVRQSRKYRHVIKKNPNSTNFKNKGVYWFVYNRKYGGTQASGFVYQNSNIGVFLASLLCHLMYCLQPKAGFDRLREAAEIARLFAFLKMPQEKECLLRLVGKSSELSVNPCDQQNAMWGWC